MTTERFILRLVPALLVATGLAILFGTGSVNSYVLGAGTLALSVLMVLALFLSERQVRLSEIRLREQARRGASIPRSRDTRFWQRQYGEQGDFDNVSVQDLDLSSVDLTDASFIGASFRDCDFSRSQLSHTDFSGATLIGSSFVAAMMRSTRLLSADIRESDISDANLDGSDWSEARVSDSSFIRVDMTRINFASARLIKSTIDQAVAIDADFSEALIEDCTLRFSDASSCDFTRSVFKNTPVRSIDLGAVVLDHTAIDGASEPHQDLIHSILRTLSENPARWAVVDSPGGYVQMIEEDGVLRCETVNFNSWSPLKQNRRMTDDMIQRLLELGFVEEKGVNFVDFVDSSDIRDLHSMAERLATALHDVYGVSLDAALEVSIGTAETIS